MRKEGGKTNVKKIVSVSGRSSIAESENEIHQPFWFCCSKERPPRSFVALPMDYTGYSPPVAISSATKPVVSKSLLMALAAAH